MFQEVTGVLLGVTMLFAYAHAHANIVHELKNVTKIQNLKKCSKEERLAGNCCNANLPLSCQKIQEDMIGQSCSKIVGWSICTECCSDLFAAGLTSSKEACCPRGECGEDSSIGCEPISGNCKCRPLTYFSGLVESCKPLDSPCKSSECCSPYACVGNVCSTCVGRNNNCSVNDNCCSPDVCYDGKCMICGHANMLCSSHETCCQGFSCVEGQCTQCIQNGKTCRHSDECCREPSFELDDWNYCDFPPSSVIGICTRCMTMETTKNARCIHSDQCCGNLICGSDGTCQVGESGQPPSSTPTPPTCNTTSGFGCCLNAPPVVDFTDPNSICQGLPQDPNMTFEWFKRNQPDGGWYQPLATRVVYEHYTAVLGVNSANCTRSRFDGYTGTTTRWTGTGISVDGEYVYVSMLCQDHSCDTGDEKIVMYPVTHDDTYQFAILNWCFSNGDIGWSVFSTFPALGESARSKVMSWVFGNMNCLTDNDIVVPFDQELCIGCHTF